MEDGPICGNCGSRRTHVVSHANRPAITVYIHCADCGETTATTLSAVAVMTPRAREVGKLVQTVLIDHCERPLELRSVVEIDGGFDVIVRTEARRLKRFHVEHGAPDVMRAAIRQALDNI